MGRRKQKTTFEKAVLATPDIQNCCKSGLTALGNYSSKIQLSSTCEGSVDIDEGVREKYPQESRWDYVFGYKNEAIFVEVHSADTSKVSEVLKKLKWLKTWLLEKAPDLNKIKSIEKSFYWIASGRYDILKGSAQHRRIVQSGLNPISRLEL